MSIIAVGLNHRSAPLDVLGEVSIPADRWPKLLTEVCSSDCINEAFVVSTCNRTEVYVDAERFHDAYRDVRDALALVSETDPARFVPHLYVHYDDEAVSHLFTVSAGLDSVVLGEHEILGQLRSAVEVAEQEGALGRVLAVLSRHALAVGRRVRSDTEIGAHTASLSQASLDAITDLGIDTHRARVLLIGTGDAGSAVATALVKKADIDLEITNRTHTRAERLAAELGATAVAFDDRSERVAEADLVICATAAPGAVVGVSDLGSRTDPVVILDLAMPSDVSEDLAADPRVTVIDLESVQRRANRGIERRQKEADKARLFVHDASQEYHRAVQVQEIEPLLGSMHRWADGIRNGELDRYRNRLGELDVEQLEAVDALTRAVVAKVLHTPSAGLRESAGTARGDRLADAARELFGLP